MPKTSSDDLFLLINSLTSSEKRYFKIYSGMSNEDNTIYLSLFNTISDLDIYNESIILEKIPAIKKSQLSNVKSYLFDLILESLITFKKKNSLDIRLRNGISEVEILFNKKLYHACHKKINSLKKLASKYEKFLYELILSRWEKSLYLTELNIKEIKSRIESKQDDEMELLKTYKNFLEYDKIISKVIYIEYKYGYERNREVASELKKLLDSKLLKSDSFALSEKSKRIICQIKSTYYYVTKHYDLAIKYLLKVIEGIESELSLNESAFSGYITQMKNIMITYMILGDTTGFEYSADKFRSLSENYRIARSEEIKIKINETLLSLQLNFYLEHNDLKKSSVIAKETIEFLDKYESKIIKLVLPDFYGLLTTHFMKVGKFSESQKWNNKVLNFSGPELKQNELAFARIMDLILNFELENEFLIESRIKSTTRFLKRINEQSGIELLILDLFKELLYCKEKSEQKIIFGTYLKKITKMKPDKIDSDIISDLGLIAWMERKTL